MELLTPCPGTGTAAVPPFGVLPFCAGSVACGGLIRVTDAKTHLNLDVTDNSIIVKRRCQCFRRRKPLKSPRDAADSLVNRGGIEYY